MPTLDDIRRAAATISGVAVRTPLIADPALATETGAEVLLKCENLQRGGAFKFRGAYTALASLAAAQRAAGVITYSSGNHAIACALAGRLLEIDVTVVCPETAPVEKTDRARALGARVVTFDPAITTREAVAADLRGSRELVPPFDDERVIAGQGTVGLEICEDTAVDLILVPVGGGGLAAGVATAASRLAPRTRVIGVEPVGADDTARSLAADRRIRVDPVTEADGLRAPEPGELTFPILARYLSGVVTVSEDAIAEATAICAQRSGMVVEPSGATALAALTSGVIDAEGLRVAVVLSGGNIGPARLAALTHGLTPDPAPVGRR